MAESCHFLNYTPEKMKILCCTAILYELTMYKSNTFVISRAEPKSAKYCLSEYASEDNNFYILKTLREFRIEYGLWNGQGHIDFGIISMFEQGALFQKEMHLLKVN